MKFDSKEHMARELLAGKRFKDPSGTEIYYDASAAANPFRYGEDSLNGAWGSYYLNRWEEVKPKHIHQDLKDSYREGQAWQYKSPKDCSWKDCRDADGKYFEPTWNTQYSYRAKPTTKVVYELMSKDAYSGKSGYYGNWSIVAELYTEEELRDLPSDIYRKTGRSWEVEV